MFCRCIQSGIRHTTGIININVTVRLPMALGAHRMCLFCKRLPRLMRLFSVAMQEVHHPGVVRLEKMFETLERVSFRFNESLR